MALSPDERFVYLQLSFLHGFVEFDLQTGKPTRIAHLPLSAEAKTLPRESYVLDSAHHGIAMNPAGTKLCVAGTMSDYAAIVARDDFSANVLAAGRKPYWATNSADGKRCFVSASGDDKVTVIDYADERIVATIGVGDHPQRMRTGVMRSEYLPPADDAVAPRISGVLVLRTRAGRVLRLVLSRGRPCARGRPARAPWALARRAGSDADAARGRHPHAARAAARAPAATASP